MNAIINPNIGYILLMGGILTVILALFVPGTGFFEVGAFFALFVAAYIMINLPINLWALILMAVAVVPLVLAVRFRKGGWILLAVSVMALFIGSLFTFRAAGGGEAVNPILALVFSAGSGGFLWFLARKTFDAALLRPSHNQDRVIGMQGTVRTDINPPQGSVRAEGSVYVGGENWSARSGEFIPAGALVRVTRRNGLVLEVVKDGSGL